MTTPRRLAAAVTLLAALAGTPALAGLVLSDVQVTATDADHWVVRVRSSGPQAFDVLPPGRDPTRVAVRLYGARVGSLAPVGATPFGTLAVQTDRAGVILRVGLAARTYHLTAAQGRSPNVVELHVSR